MLSASSHPSRAATAVAARRFERRLKQAIALAACALLLQPIGAQPTPPAAAQAGAQPGVAAPSSQLARIDGRDVEFVASRVAAPRATVVFENGLMLELSTWQAVTSTLADCCNVLVYNRAGVGRSEAANEAPQVNEAADTLLALLASQRLEPPYVVVGHSLGGQYAQLFAARHPDLVAALVLVDALPVGTVKPFADFPWYTRAGLALFAPPSAQREIANIHPMGEALLAGPRLDGRRVIRLVAHNQASAPKAQGLVKDLLNGVILAEDFGVWAVDPDTAEVRMDTLYEGSIVEPVATHHHRIQERSVQTVAAAIRRAVAAATCAPRLPDAAEHAEIAPAPVVPAVRVELTTFRLQGGCSTN